jgi:hypothetical protein
MLNYCQSYRQIDHSRSHVRNRMLVRDKSAYSFVHLINLSLLLHYQCLATKNYYNDWLIYLYKFNFINDYSKTRFVYKIHIKYLNCKHKSIIKVKRLRDTFHFRRLTSTIPLTQMFFFNMLYMHALLKMQLSLYFHSVPSIQRKKRQHYKASFSNIHIFFQYFALFFAQCNLVFDWGIGWNCIAINCAGILFSAIMLLVFGDEHKEHLELLKTMSFDGLYLEFA